LAAPQGQLTLKRLFEKEEFKSTKPHCTLWRCK